MTAAPQARSSSLTYEEYMAEGEINRRYDILNGVRRYMTNPTRRHQRIQRRLILLMAPFEEQEQSGQTLSAPCDILISKQPLRTRQPDVLFISKERLSGNAPDNDPAPLDPAPELVIEIRSPSDSVGVLASKLADYQKVNVRECWIVQPEQQTVELLALSTESIDSLGIYTGNSTLISVVFPGLQIAVSDIFTEQW